MTQLRKLMLEELEKRYSSSILLAAQIARVFKTTIEKAFHLRGRGTMTNRKERERRTR